MDKHTVEMGIAQVTAIGLSMSDVEQWLRITSLVIAISFGVYKWVEKITKKDK
tara:strand:- start:373 stop:531 length:159 start_codon:yes stop_codon:yes gene_type:complete